MKPNVLIVFSNGRPDQNKLSKDRWTILKISKDLTELTDIHGRKLEKRKELITHFGAGEVKHEKENIDSDASGKRKSNEMEADGQMFAKMPKSMIETNQQYGAGRVEPEKEKNLNLEMMLIDDFNMDLLTPEDEASRKRKSSEMEADGQMSANMPKTMIETNQQYGAGRVEPEKEKNPPQLNE